MIEREVAVSTQNGTMLSFFVQPDETESYPAVIVYFDAPGMREELRNIARRIARAGYCCLLPDLYYRYGALRLNAKRRDEGMRQLIRAAFSNLGNAEVMQDTAGMMAFLDGQPCVKGERVGGLGYCFSGRHVSNAATIFGHRFAGTASLYGTGIVTDQADSPHLGLDRVGGEIYFAFAETDPSTPPNYIAAIKERLSAGTARHEVEIHPRTLHGYAFPERSEYNAAASDATWRKVFALWERTLKQ